jgi:hypothetical protein
MRTRRSGERAEDLVELGEAVLPLLREDDTAVGDDVELGTPAFDRRGVVPLGAQVLGEAHGPPVVPASDGAVEDLDPRHCRGRYTPERNVRLYARGDVSRRVANCARIVTLDS